MSAICLICEKPLFNDGKTTAGIETCKCVKGTGISSQAEDKRLEERIQQLEWKVEDLERLLNKYI